MEAPSPQAENTPTKPPSVAKAAKKAGMKANALDRFVTVEAPPPQAETTPTRPPTASKAAKNVGMKAKALDRFVTVLPSSEAEPQCTPPPGSGDSKRIRLSYAPSPAAAPPGDSRIAEAIEDSPSAGYWCDLRRWLVKSGSDIDEESLTKVLPPTPPSAHPG